MRYVNSKYPKKYFKLWWEYLKRSEDYKCYCFLLRKQKNNSSLKLPEQLTTVIYHKMDYIYGLNGDIFNDTFENWYIFKKYEIDRLNKHYQNMTILKSNEFFKIDIDIVIQELTQKFKREPTLRELQAFYKNDSSNNSGYYVVDPYEPKVIETLKELIKKTDGTPRKPIIKYDAITRYLKIYDLYKKFERVKTKPGEVLDEVIKKFYPNFNPLYDENADTKRQMFSRDNKNAKRIIKNTENEIFPGIY